MSRYNYEDCPQGIASNDKERNLNYLFLFEYISKFLCIKNKIKILEIGTGGGRNLQAIHQEFGDKVELFGTDISNTAINYAKSLKIGKFYQARSDVIPIAEKFDLILMVDVLEHLETRNFVEKTIKNAFLHLNNNGNIYISVPIELNRFSLTWFFNKLPYFKNLTKIFYGHSIQFDREDFFRLINTHEFRFKELFYSVHFLSQLQVLLFFFLPKILLQSLFGKKVGFSLRDSNEIINCNGNSFLYYIKRIFVTFSRPISYLAFKESNLRRNSFFGAGNMHLLISKK